jgi:hypothetical protein
MGVPVGFPGEHRKISFIVRSVTPSSTNCSPEARKDWPGCGWSVDGDVDKVVVDGAVEDVGEVGDAAEGARKDWPGSRKE